MDILMEGCDEVSKLTITERAYKAFAKEVKDHHPDVTYAVSKFVIQDEGVGKTSGETFRGITRVTEDEYNAIKTERFAREGWRALQGLQVAKWELRNASYHGPFVTLARAVFSNTGNSSMPRWQTYVRGDPKRQAILEAALE